MEGTRLRDARMQDVDIIYAGFIGALVTSKIPWRTLATFSHLWVIVLPYHNLCDSRVFPNSDNQENELIRKTCLRGLWPG